MFYSKTLCTKWREYQVRGAARREEHGAPASPPPRLQHHRCTISKHRPGFTITAWAGVAAPEPTPQFLADPADRVEQRGGKSPSKVVRTG